MPAPATLTVATVASVALQVGVALQEARVLALAENAKGGLLVAQTPALRDACRLANAVLIGPGMQDDTASAALVRALLPDCAKAALILDAGAMQAVCDGGIDFPGPLLLTAHAGEMAHLTGLDKAAIVADVQGHARRGAQSWQASVALNGSLTVIAHPDGRSWQHTGGNTGLAISGSGDVLAGLISGLAARGAALEQAAAWGVALHAMAGEHLAFKHGPLGYLARELSAEIPALMRVLAAH